MAASSFETETRRSSPVPEGPGAGCFSAAPLRDPNSRPTIRSTTRRPRRRRFERNQSDQLVSPRLDERLGVSGFLQGPSELIAQARFLVDIELVGARELFGAGEDGMMRISQPLGGLLVVRLQARGGRALDEFGGDRLRQLVDILSIEPLQNRP